MPVVPVIGLALMTRSRTLLILCLPSLKLLVWSRRRMLDAGAFALKCCGAHYVAVQANLFLAASTCSTSTDGLLKLVTVV